MNKLGLIITAVVIFIIFFIIILMSIFNKPNEIAQNETGNKPTPTTFKLNNFKLTPTPPATYERLKKQLMQKLYDSTDFTAYWSPELGKIVIVKKTANADAAIQAWARANGIESLLNNGLLFLVLNKATTAKTLTEEQRRQIEAAKLKLPYQSPEFDVIYDENGDLFIIKKKKPNVDNAVNDWINDNLPPEILNGTNIPPAIITTSLSQDQTLSMAPPLLTATPFKEQQDLLNYFDEALKIALVESESLIPTTTPPPAGTPGGGNLDYSAWGLPPPKAEDSGSIRGYNRLLDQLRNNPNATWAARSLLDAEKEYQSKGGNIIRYLNTAWIWFENGSAAWPDPYEVNCNDDRPGFTSEATTFCSVTNFQIAGYQAATRKNDYVRIYQMFYSEGDLRNVMQNVINNSDKASQNKWKYSSVVSIPNNITLNDIAPNKDFFDQTTQRYTLILGKDPKMATALNSFAVSEGDLIRALKTECGYGYICANHKQTLSNIVAALYIFENGSLPSSGGGIDRPPPGQQPSEIAGCPPSSQQVSIPGTSRAYLDRRDKCIKPTMIVIHYTVNWISAETTLDVLNDRGLSCQLATDGNHQLQALNFYRDSVERAACVLGYNDYSISNEISGDSFDSVYNNPSHPKYNELMQSTNRALASSCWAMKQYGIGIDQVYGHYELTPGKQDPGPKYLAYFINRLDNECK